ncbi:MAG: hypothetical protein AAF801_18805, partial [Pseudomonadota bacterium]
MTTNFALSLSFEGIELLHRVQHGWKRVGRADVEDENLDTVLADLRAKAEALAPDGLRTKLIIPLDQIKYIAIDSTQTTEEDINAELDGATPYALNELVIDCERFGGRTHIAAVARETLVEAETFAHAHGFNPVCFVAVPEPFTFQKEVFFGPTSMMRDFLGWDGEVERDPLPVMVVGTRIKSRLLVFDLPEEVIPPSDDDLDLTAALSKSDPPPEPEKSAEDEAPSQGFDLAAALAPFVDDKPDADAPQGETMAPPPAPADLSEDKPTLPLALDEGEKAEDPAEILAADPGTSDQTPDQPVEAVEAPAEQTSEAEAPTQEKAAPEQPPLFDTVIAEVTAQPIASTTAVAEPTIAPAPEPAAPARVVIPTDVDLFAPPLFDAIIAEYHKPKLIRSRRQRSRLIALAPPTLAAAPKLQTPPPAQPIPPVPTANDNRRPALIAGAIAVSLVLIGVMAWAVLRDTDAAIIPDDPTAIAVEEALQEASAAPTTTTETETTGPAPSPPQTDIADITAPTDTSGDVNAIAGVTDAPPTDIEPQALTTATVPDALPSPIQPAPDAPVQEQAAATVGAPILRGRVLSPADAARIYTATGVWQRAPRFVDVPGTTS